VTLEGTGDSSVFVLSFTRFKFVNFITLFYILIVAPCISTNYLISIPTDAQT